MVGLKNTKTCFEFPVLSANFCELGPVPNSKPTRKQDMMTSYVNKRRPPCLIWGRFSLTWPKKGWNAPERSNWLVNPLVDWKSRLFPFDWMIYKGWHCKTTHGAVLLLVAAKIEGDKAKHNRFSCQFLGVRICPPVPTKKARMAI